MSVEEYKLRQKPILDDDTKNASTPMVSKVHAQSYAYPD